MAMPSSPLERTVLGKGVAGQSRALKSFGNFDADCGRVRRGDPSRPQHGVLREYFAVHLGDQIILAIGIAAPHLPELNRIYGHHRFSEENGLSPDYRVISSESIIPLVTEVSAKILPSCPAAKPHVNPPVPVARKALGWRGRSRPRKLQSGEQIQPRARAVGHCRREKNKPRRGGRNWPEFQRPSQGRHKVTIPSLPIALPKF